jgi:hypothetical protein
MTSNEKPGSCATHRPSVQAVGAGGPLIPHARAGFVACSFVLLSLAGCTTNTGAPPSGNGNPYLPADSVESVVQNIMHAFNDLDISGYQDAVGASFNYEPDGQTTLAFPGVDWNGWGNPQEITFATNLFNSVSAISLNLHDTDFNVAPPSGGFGEWDLIYFMTVTAADGSVTRYRARALLDFTLIDSDWYLTAWSDLEGENDPDSGNLLPTSGSLRGAFAGKSGGVN